MFDHGRFVTGCDDRLGLEFIYLIIMGLQKLKVLLSETKAGQPIRLSARAVSAITVKASSTSLRGVICRRDAVSSHRDHYRKKTRGSCKNHSIPNHFFALTK